MFAYFSGGGNLIDEDKQYDALLIDTSIYERHGLRLEKGLLSKLFQFRKSPIELLMPDVIRNEVQDHLGKKIKSARSSLEKALNDASDHLFFDGSALNDAKNTLIDSDGIENLAATRVEQFIENSGATKISCGDHVSVTAILDRYFKNMPPFASTGKKKSEFPDAIVLLSIEEWANEQEKTVLAVSKDGDWEKYCETSVRIDHCDDLSAALDAFNKANAPYALLANLETAVAHDSAATFFEKVSHALGSALDGITPGQDADSYLYWDPEGISVWFEEFQLIDDEFRVVETGDDWVVLEALASIKLGAEGDFSLSVYDSIDKDHVYMGSVTAETKEEFESEILITVSGDLTGPLDALDVEEVEVVSPITMVHFGTIEPDWEPDEDST